MKHCKEPKSQMRHVKKPSANNSGKTTKRASVRQLVTGVFAITATLTLLVTIYAMKLPAITASNADCGIEEHTHTDSCYSKKLICTNTEGDHVHTEECYSDQKVLTCGKEQHTHTDECYHEETVAETVAETKPDLANTGEVIPTENDALSGCTDLEEYLKGVNGSAESYLYDDSGNLIDNVFEAAGGGYTYEFSLYADYIVPGSYYYNLPKHILVEEEYQTGDMLYEGVIIGTYRIVPDIPCLIFDFNENVNQYQNITGELSFDCSFAERMKPSVAKNGYLISDDNETDGYFHFTIEAKIPSAYEGVPKREWTLLDRSRTTVITDQIVDRKDWYHDFGSEINAPNTHVYLSYGNVERYELHPLQDVYKDDSVSIAYYTDSESKLLYLVNRCTCHDSTCVTPGDSCTCERLASYSGWCTCWSLEEDATLTIEYKNAVNGADGSLILKDQKELTEAESADYLNTVTLKGIYNKNGVPFEESKLSTKDIEYSALLYKNEVVQAKSTNGMRSTFEIVVNPQMADLSKLDVDGDGNYDEEVSVYDMMTNQKYVTGSMTIAAEDKNGDVFMLVPNTDFIVNAEQTETGTAATILLKKLGPWKYKLTYKSQAFSSTDGPLKIMNNASVKFFGYKEWGQTDDQDNPEYEYSRTFSYKDKWLFKKFEVTLRKVDAFDQTVRLKDAVYGLYSIDGTEVARRTTGENGEAIFATDIERGLIFDLYTPYYLKEISAPEDYDINTIQYWFYFGDSPNAELEERLSTSYPGANITFIGPDESGGYQKEIVATDEKVFVLPETGGIGLVPTVCTGILLITAAGCLILFRKKKHGLTKR